MDVLTHLLESIEQRLAASEASTAELRQLLPRQAPGPGPWTAAVRTVEERGQNGWKPMGNPCNMWWKSKTMTKIWWKYGEPTGETWKILEDIARTTGKCWEKLIFRTFGAELFVVLLVGEWMKFGPANCPACCQAGRWPGECSPRWIWGMTAWYFKMFQALKWGISWLLRWVKR